MQITGRLITCKNKMRRRSPGRKGDALTGNRYGMGWLLELLIEGIRELCSQFIVDMMSLVTDMFTELLSCDLSLFEELFSVVGGLYSNAVMPMGIAILLLICIWQLFKSMFGKMGVASEDPIELVCRSGICLFFIVAAKPMVDYVLKIAGTPYQWVAGTEIEVSSFSEYVSVLEALTAGIGIDSLSIAVLTLILQFVVAWNYFKMLFVIAERYVLLGVFSYTAPLAFGTGGSKATNNILASWSKMFGGQIVLIILNSWYLKMFLSGYGNLNASRYGFTKFFAATLCLIGFCKVTFKLDSYLSSLGVNLGRPTTGMGALGLMMAAGRIFSHVGRGSGSSSGSSSGNGEGAGSDSYTDGSGMTGPAGPIPMGLGADGMEGSQTGGDTDFGSTAEEELTDTGMQTGDFDTMVDGEEGSILEEMGMMPEETGIGSEELESLDTQGAETVFDAEGSAFAEMGDYPVEEEELETDEAAEAGMNLDGTMIGDSSVGDAGLGSGMDAFGNDGSISEGSRGSEMSVPAGPQGIISEIGSEAGIRNAETCGAENRVDAGNRPLAGGEPEISLDAHGFSSDKDFREAGNSDTKVFPKTGGYEVNGLGYHDFDTPGYKNGSVNPETGSHNPVSETRKQEYRKVTEERKIREVPKSRKELKKKKKQNPKHKNGDSFR